MLLLLWTYFGWEKCWLVEKMPYYKYIGNRGQKVNIDCLRRLCCIQYWQEDRLGYGTIFILTLWRLTKHIGGRTAPLTSKRCISYIYSTTIGTEYFKHGIYSPFFSLQNAVCFIILTYLVPVSFAFYIQCVLKLKKNSGAKRLTVHEKNSTQFGVRIPTRNLI